MRGYKVVSRLRERKLERKRYLNKSERLFFCKKKLAYSLAGSRKRTFTAVSRPRTARIITADGSQHFFTAAALESAVAVGIVHRTVSVKGFDKSGVALGRRMVEDIKRAVKPAAERV